MDILEPVSCEDNGGQFSVVLIRFTNESFTDVILTARSGVGGKKFVFKTTEITCCFSVIDY